MQVSAGQWSSQEAADELNACHCDGKEDEGLGREMSTVRVLELAFRTTFGDNDKEAEEPITAGRLEDGLIPI